MTLTVLWLTALIMFAGGTALLVLGKRRAETEGVMSLAHGIVPIIAGCLYVAMATGQGAMLLPTDATLAGAASTTRIFWFGRYIDWVFTTPLLLVGLGFLGMFRGRKRGDLLLGAVSADVIMVITAFAFSASENIASRWIWFLLSCIAFLGVYYVIWVSQLEANRLEHPEVQSAYIRSATILSVLWMVYPIILALSPDGLGIVSDSASVLVIAVTDVLAKVGFGFISLSDDRKLASV
ncbi:bacteriorhodopsin [Asaia siamensis]|uniref:Rhodopsin n=1 Tax=Asaia siamensis TaxID=110479 RepID=A0ABQ1MD49_9PROT|nr:bacteriorhodopsin [Asaia siamensis]GBR07590.1 bacteriorhodopsin [Asaia siamensis NRIC 0323]GGC36612.1 rhodopsin [Asaia siamensis]